MRANQWRRKYGSVSMIRAISCKSRNVVLVDNCARWGVDLRSHATERRDSSIRERISSTRTERRHRLRQMCRPVDDWGQFKQITKVARR